MDASRSGVVGVGKLRGMRVRLQAGPMARRGPGSPHSVMLRTLAAVVALAALLALPAQGQDRPFPYAFSSRHAILPPLAAGWSLLGDRLADGRTPLTRQQVQALKADDVNVFDRWATRSWSSTWSHRSDQTLDLVLASAVAVTFVPQIAKGRWRDGAILGVMFTDAYLVLRGATYSAKGLTGRKRPFMFNTELSVDERLGLAASDPQDAYHAFFSAHAAAAFTLATLMSTTFTDVYGRSTTSDVLWASSMTVAGLTAYARVKAGQHYPSDVLVGAAVGAAIGYGIPWLHRKERHAPVRLSVGPAGMMLSLSH